MRVLIVSKSFPPYQSARSLQISKVVNAIGKQTEIHVIAGLPENCNNQSDELVDYVNYSAVKKPNNIITRIHQRFSNEFNSSNYYGNWVKKTCKVAENVIQKFKPDILMTSSSPFESHLVGLHLSRRNKIPWVASFSDPWPSVLMPTPYNINNVPILSNLQMFMMKKIVRECNAIHMTNEYAIELVEKAIGLFIQKKSYVIPHISNSCPSNKKIDLDLSDKLVHIGDLSRERVSIELLKAVKHMISQHKKTFGGMVFIGGVCQEFRNLISKMQLENDILILGKMTSSESMKYALNSRVLLLVEADMKKSPFLPSKFVDYIVTKRPILAITPTISPIRDYLNRNSTCYTVNHETKEIFNALCDTFNQTNCLQENHILQEEFTSSNIANQYIGMFNQIFNMQDKCRQ